MKKIWEVLYYGGVSREEYHKIEQDIDTANRKSIIVYSAISLLAFFAMAVFAFTGQNAVSKNRYFYLIGIMLMAVFLIANIFFAQNHRFLIHFSAYFFVVALIGIGILLAVSSIEDVTASYMVFLFVAPLLFSLRPLYVDFLILFSDVIYIICMRQLQIPELYQKNIVNAVIYGALSIFVCNTMTRTRILKVVTDNMNRMLMETDQLTGMLNRHSFAQHMQRLAAHGNSAGIKIGAFDVNGLKKANDTIGHHAGDELICGAASCIENAFSHYGFCYRVGGDEFVVIIEGASPTEEELQILLEKQTTSYRGTLVPTISISSGIVAGKEDETIEELLRRADAQMYQNKALYYSKAGFDRRKR